MTLSETPLKLREPPLVSVRKLAKHFALRRGLQKEGARWVV